MAQTKTKEMCARCDAHLYTNNKSPDRLCGGCQKELSPHQNTKKYQLWVARGKKREHHRTPGGRLKDINSSAPPAEKPPQPMKKSIKGMTIEQLMSYRRDLQATLDEATLELAMRKQDLVRLVDEISGSIESKQE